MDSSNCDNPRATINSHSSDYVDLNDLLRDEICHGHLSHHPVLFDHRAKAIIMGHTMFIGVFSRQKPQLNHNEKSNCDVSIY